MNVRILRPAGATAARAVPLALVAALVVAPLAAAQVGAGATGGARAALSVTGGTAQARGGGPSIRQEPPRAWNQQDPADALYRAARTSLNREEYARAAEQFDRIVKQYPRSTYAPDALYWKAFALYRRGGQADLRNARAALDQQRRQYPRASTRGDADALAARIQGALAQLGDARAAEDVVARGSAAAAGSGRGNSNSNSNSNGRARTDNCPASDSDMKAAALNALLQMDADRAMPILRQVLAKRDGCSAPLRRKAVFLVSQKRTDETEDILLSAVRNDPDPEVREQAVFWLSQVPSERSLQALEEILRTSDDPKVQEKAIFALSQHRAPRAARVLRDYAERPNIPSRLRENAIFWLGQRNSGENAAYLRELYGKLDDARLKDKVIFSLSQMRSSENAEFLMGIALNTRETTQLRKQALFWAGQMGTVPTSQLVQLYDRMPDRQMKDQLVFVYSQRKDREAVDKLIEIARRDPDSELRKRALFWLSQSKDPRVADLLMELIDQ